MKKLVWRRRWWRRRLTHMTRLPWPLEWSSLMGFRPVTSSRRTTPNEYTSIFSLTFPYMKYSGARYPKVPTTSP
ncbi:unnamed protein product [Spirodela intermedia]|uniref:Uncharacterized protein n=2 Tax=Spirodela intermedia TaxID=51605 RepID=A0A7I8IF30_SPIIN|nr:unnamed protein product [Spirodela intermedia]CAA6655994.1 unnamed protein product [Spirodela intermedia]CAA7391415.1 unnamed protein product [Spirodela intermedia]